LKQVELALAARFFVLFGNSKATFRRCFKFRNLTLAR
jgi:hypothetical protein